MPKERKEAHSEFLLRMTQTFPKVFRVDQSVLYCLFCDCSVSGRTLNQVKQHIATTKHQKGKERKNRPDQSASQSMISTYVGQRGPTLSCFNIDLCKTFLEANIPLYKIDHPSIIAFFEKYTSHSIPGMSTLRRNYVPRLYENLIERLRAKAVGKRIWVSLDETADVERRMVASFVFGILDDESERDKSYMLNIAELDKVNASTIAKFFTDSLLFLWPTGNFISCLCLLCTYGHIFIRPLTYFVVPSRNSI